MLTNSVVSAIDPHNRSPFSNILVKMLRDDLSFWGLIITDDLSSPVIVNGKKQTNKRTKDFTRVFVVEKKPREIGVLALKAGMDVLLFQYNAMDMAQEAYEGVLQAVIDDTLPLVRERERGRERKTCVYDVNVFVLIIFIANCVGCVSTSDTGKAFDWGAETTGADCAAGGNWTFEAD